MKLPKHYELIFLFVFYCICSIISWYYHRYNWDADAMSYLSITKQCTTGNWSSLINGYWSPLMCILLLPLSIFNGPSIEAFQLTNIILGWLAIVVVYKIVAVLKIQAFIRLFGMIAISFVMSIWSLREINADILFLLSLLILFYTIITDKIFNNTLLFCIVGSFVFFSKSYGLFFFIGEMGFLIVYKLIIKHQLNYKKLSYGILLYATIIFVWGILLSKQYNRFTLSETGVYNAFAIREGFIKHAPDTMLLIPPKQQMLISAWQDITLHVNDSVLIANAKLFSPTQIEKIPIKICQTVELINTNPRYGFWLFFIPAFIILFLNKQKRYFLVILLSSILTFSLGYILYFIEYRYLLFMYLLVYLGMLYLANDFILNQNYFIKIVTSTLLLYLFARWGIDNYRNLSKGEGNASYYIIQKMAQYKNLKDKTYVTNKLFIYEDMAFKYQMKHYGSIKNYATDSLLLEKDLLKYNIDFLILSDSVTIPQNVKQHYLKSDTTQDHMIIYTKN
jgi:hypothetical protein